MVFLGQVLLFSITGCPFCARAKKMLTDMQVPYADINLEKYPERRYEMQERTGRRTVPQIFFNSKHIGGFDDLKKLSDEGKLEELVQEVAETEVPPDAPQPPPEDTDQLPDKAARRDSVPDQLATLVREIQDSGLIRSHFHRLVRYKTSFVGRELVTWLVNRRNLKSRDEGVQLGMELFRQHFIHHVTFDHDFRDENLLYRLLGDGHVEALNAQLSHASIPRPAPEVAEDLRRHILEIYGEHLSPDGLAVDYRGISQSSKFEAYVRATAELKRVYLTDLSRNEKVAFFINIYNALVIHAFVVQGPPTNLWKRLKFFYHVSYIIGGRVYSLNDIESGVLRANRKPVGAFKRPFGRNDPRLRIALEEPEPRVHFALVCGARSCPPIKTYSAANLDEELNVAMESFLEGENCLVDMERREVSLSRILKWYRVDFGTTSQEILRWVAAHLPAGTKKEQINELLHHERGFKLKFLTYNWDLNTS